MKKTSYFIIPFLVLLSSLMAVYAQEETQASSIGRPAPATDPLVERVIGESIHLNELKWTLSAHYESSPAAAYWEWKDGKRKVMVIVSYLASRDDAKRRVEYTLKGVALPKYKPIYGIGEEAYLITETGPVLFRVKSVVVDVSGHKVKAAVIRRFAELIASAVRAT